MLDQNNPNQKVYMLNVANVDLLHKNNNYESSSFLILTLLERLLQQQGFQ